MRDERITAKNAQRPGQKRSQEGLKSEITNQDKTDVDDASNVKFTLTVTKDVSCFILINQQFRLATRDKTISIFSATKEVKKNIFNT